MSRWGRRATRQPHPDTRWPSHCAELSLAPGTPPDVAELARLAAIDGPALLAGRDPETHGLLVVHPLSPVCPDRHAGGRRVLFQVVRLSWLRELAERLHLRGGLEVGPRRFAALLVGKRQSAHLALAAADDGDSIARAS